MNIQCPSCHNTEKRKGFKVSDIIACSRCGWEIINNNRKLRTLTQEEVDKIADSHHMYLCGVARGIPADFSYCNLAGMDFSDKDLRRADFHGSDLSGANFTNTILRSADFRGTNVRGTDFTGSARNDIKLGPVT